MDYRKISAALIAAGCLLFGSAVCQAQAGGSLTAVSSVGNQPLSVRQGKIKDALGKIAAVKNKADSGRKVSAKKSAAKTSVKTSGLDVRSGRVYYDNVELPSNYQTISIYGDAVATRGQAVKFIETNNPDVKLACSVDELVNLYWEEAERENVRPDLALCQAVLETGFFKYGGDVDHNQNNFCGLGTTGGGVKGATFKTPKIGVRAHIQHLLAYTQKKRPSTSIVDPRYELAHRLRMERGVVDTWYGLNGTWAMGSHYCEKIMVRYQRLLAVEDDGKDYGEDKKKDSKKDKKEKRRESMRERIEKILKEGR